MPPHPPPSPFRGSSPPPGTTPHMLRDGPYRRVFHDVHFDRACVTITTPIQTFLDPAPELSLVDLVVLGDSLLRRGRFTPEMLVEAATTRRGRGCRLPRRAAALVRPEADSAMKTRLRLLMVLAGLPEPVVNHKIRWPDGRVRSASTSPIPTPRSSSSTTGGGMPEDLREPR